MRRANEKHDYHITIDLEHCKIHDDHGFTAVFQIDEFSRKCLLEGLDEIGLTLQHETEIAAYERSHPVPLNMQHLSVS